LEFGSTFVHFGELARSWQLVEHIRNQMCCIGNPQSHSPDFDRTDSSHNSQVSFVKVSRVKTHKSEEPGQELSRNRPELTGSGRNGQDTFHETLIPPAFRWHDQAASGSRAAERSVAFCYLLLSSKAQACRHPEELSCLITISVSTKHLSMQRCSTCDQLVHCGVLVHHQLILIAEFITSV
jgi:hypothetical protein